MGTITEISKVMSYDPKTGIIVYKITLDTGVQLVARQLFGRNRAKQDRLWAKQQDD